MRSYIFIVFSVVVFASCSTKVQQSAPTGALTANSAIETASARPFGRQNLGSATSHFMNEFIRPDVRAKLDEEPVGDTDSGYDPSTSEPSSASEPASSESSGEEVQVEEPQPQNTAEESYPTGARFDSTKFAWAKKAFGDAVKASPGSGGVIVLYADEDYYDTERLARFVEEGRDLIAERSGIGGENIQVVYGGYRAVPQVEYWVIPPGGAMPEFKPETRP